MKIKEVLDRHRNDFWAIYECEHCEAETPKQSGYEDSYFHAVVIPAKYCKSCGKNRAGLTVEQAKVNEDCV